MTSGKRHVPLRACAVCGSKSPKRELLRLVALPESAVQIDPTGKMPGRGGYICKDGICTRAGLKKARIEYTLRRAISEGEWADLTSSIEDVFSSQSVT